jgi:hypothetical protein
MIHLPEHIVRRIIRFSDPPSQVRLAATCTLLQPLAEEHIWERIDLTRYPHEMQPERPITAASVLYDILDALHSPPARQMYVKVIEIQPTIYDIELFTQLMLLLSNKVVHLTLLPVATHLLHCPNSPFSVLEQANFVLADAGINGRWSL